MRKADQVKGIFCLEGLWESDLRKGSTVRPLLELLRINVGIPYIHRECATGGELEFYLHKWPQRRYSNYPILYLASHGETFGIQLEDGFFDLDGIANIISSSAENRIVIISACETLDVDKRHLKRFVQETNCLAICGYQSDVDWMRSAAFEILLLSVIQENEFSGRGISAIEQKASDLASSFRDLKFRMVPQQG